MTGRSSLSLLPAGSGTAPAADEDPYADPASPAWASAVAGVLTGGRPPTLVVQPIVDLARGAVAGYEVLSRFAGPPTAAPDRWFAAAAVHGLGSELEAYVVRSALQLRADLPPNRFLTVNVTPNLLAHPSLLKPLLAAGDLQGVFLELTEHVPVADPHALLDAIGQLRGVGASIALDDAGSGYSGLAQIALVRPELVKLDRALVDGIDADPAKFALAEVLGDFVGRLDGWLLAEGVERVEELAVLARLQVPLAQGWLFARPSQPWAEVDVVTVELIRTLASRSSLVDVLAALLDQPVTTTAGEVAAAGSRMLASDATDTVVVVDGQDRPRRVLLRRSRRGRPDEVEDKPVGLRLHPGTELAEAARRAAARHRDDRHDPLLCTDGAGRLVGVVPIERLLYALANLGNGSPARTRPATSRGLRS